jgi:HlyD family secretion protein
VSHLRLLRCNFPVGVSAVSPVRRDVPANPNYLRLLCPMLWVLAAGCGNSGVAAKPVPAAPQASAAEQLGLRVSVLTLAPSAQAGELSFDGQIVARAAIQILPPMEGLRIVRVLADAGQRVAARAVLLELDAIAMDAELAQATQLALSAQAGVAQSRAQVGVSLSKLRLASADQARYESVAAGAVSAQDVTTRQNITQQAKDEHALALATMAAAQAQVRVATAAMELARLRRARLTVRAPVAGVLSERHADIGAMASMSSAPLFLLQPEGEREFEAELDLAQLAQLPSDADASVRVAQSPAVFSAHLRTRASNVRTTDRRGPVRFALENADQLAIGASASATVSITATPRLALPSAAVMFDAQPWVYVVQPAPGNPGAARVQKRTVQLSTATADGYFSVLAGLAAGEQVVASAASLLSPGALVRPVLLPSALVRPVLLPGAPASPALLSANAASTAARSSAEAPQ